MCLTHSGIRGVYVVNMLFMRVALMVKGDTR